MAEATRVENVRKALAEVTGTLEDASIIAAEGQGARNLADARQTCDRLISALGPCVARLKLLRRRLQ